MMNCLVLSLDGKSAVDQTAVWVLYYCAVLIQHLSLLFS